MSNVPSAGTTLNIATFDQALGTWACDLRRLKFIDAYGLVGMACAMRAGDTRDVRLPDATGMREHLGTMGFRNFLLNVGASVDLPDVPAAASPDVVVPFRSTTDSSGAQALSHLLWQQLTSHVDPQVLNAITEGVWEMVGNALEHSGTDALIMGQVYRVARGGSPPDHADRVQVVIGVGQGIRESFLATGSYAPETDIQAIDLALTYLVTSVIDDPGRGQGLSTTMEQVTQTQGKMVVRSGTGKISITANGRRREEVPFLPGVIVALSLPLYPG